MPCLTGLFNRSLLKTATDSSWIGKSSWSFGISSLEQPNSEVACPEPSFKSLIS
ncbi:hypothetical protein OIU79_006126 [Salix purpurea]|uniref:Uncharacterized protein n=1 Tax=Salix purpurea TaxID=77065 RepID=A0A9Q0TUQ7_SALPP|nr:hypothetical protein OIU79_006126 [Salix purpurea]